MQKKLTTMWRKIRIEKGLTIKQVAYDLKVSDKCISKYELGTKSMPTYAQIYYLKMRGLEIDLINAKYLQNILNERKVFEEIYRNRKRGN